MPSRSTLVRLLLVVTAAIALSSCASAGNSPTNLAGHLAVLPRTPACVEAGDPEERLIIDWSPLERSKLESAVRKGLVMVRVTGCTARIADLCASRRRYAYAPTSRQREVTVVRDADELRTKLPLGAARFEASMQQSSALNVTMTVVGRYESPDEPLSATDVEGNCEGVTHVVSSLSVGAFEISAESDARLSGNADVMLVGAHAASGAERRHLDSAGVEARCAEARRADTAPPDDCGIPLRLELRRIGSIARARVESNASSDSRNDADELQRATAMTKTEIAPCYRRALALDPRLDGRLTLAISVGREGNVRSVSVKHDVADALAGCAVSRVERVVFPRADDERPRLFVVPIVFRGAGGADGNPRSLD